VANVNNQLQVSSQAQLNLPGATENKQAVGGTSDQSTIAQSTGTQSSQPEATESVNTTAQTSPSPTGQQPSDQSSLGQYGTNQFGQLSQNGLSLTNQSSTTLDQKAPDQNLSPTSDQSTSRIYSTNQSTLDTAASSGTAGAETLNAKIQGATEADRTLGRQIAQELRTNATLATVLPKIRINVESGKITLSGTVKSEDQKKKIESAVQRVTGVVNMEDHLRVSASSEEGTTQDNQPENK